MHYYEHLQDCSCLVSDVVIFVSFQVKYFFINNVESQASF